MKEINEKTVTVEFEGILERDMDLLFMRKLSYDYDFLNHFFLGKIGFPDSEVESIDISHSVVTEDGESDIEVVLSIGGKRIALLIEDKVNAPAMEEQAKRYDERGRKAVERGDYNEYHIFIIAPEKYLKTNAEAKKYNNRISYESIQKRLNDPFEAAVMDRVLSNKSGVALARNPIVTAFWDQVYDFADQHYPGLFKIDGQRGLERSGTPGQWITIRYNELFGIQIKSSMAYVDLEIRGYAGKFEEFCKNNKDLIDEKRLFIRTAGKSLAIRRYIQPIDFTQPFETQTENLRIAFDAAKDLQGLIPFLKLSRA